MAGWEECRERNGRRLLIGWSMVWLGLERRHGCAGAWETFGLGRLEEERRKAMILRRTVVDADLPEADRANNDQSARASR